MQERLESFIQQVGDFTENSYKEVILGFAYFLKVSEVREIFTVADIVVCYKALHLKVYDGIGKLLSNYSDKSTASRDTLFIRQPNGYSLARDGLKLCEELFPGFLKKPIYVSKTTGILNNLISQINEPTENEFFKETVKCFDVEAYRAAIILMWSLTVNHLYHFILNHRLADFNLTYSTSTDKTIQENFKKTGYVTRIEDFLEIKESKFIDLCGNASITDKNVNKILKECLDRRNTAAHPSNISFDDATAASHIKMLVTNVIARFPL